MADEDKPEQSSSKFGTCCQDLKEILEAEDFDSLIYEADDGVLYLSVGILDLDDTGPDDDESDGSGFLDHPMYFCPFCGTKLQTPEEVEKKATDA